MNPNLIWNIEQGLPLTTEQVGQTEMERTALYHCVRQFFERYDLLLTPTVAVPPFPVGMHYPQEFNISNESHELGRENRGFFHRQFSP